MCDLFVEQVRICSYENAINLMHRIFIDRSGVKTVECCLIVYGLKKQNKPKSEKQCIKHQTNHDLFALRVKRLDFYDHRSGNTKETVVSNYGNETSAK